MACLGLEVQARLARKRRDEGGNHRGQKGQKGRVGVVLSALPSFAERGFVGKGTQRVNVHEEVVDEGVHGGQRAYGLGGKLCNMRRLQLGQGVGGVGGRVRRRVARVQVVVEAALLDGLGMSIGRASSAAWAVKGAWDVEGDAGATWRA